MTKPLAVEGSLQWQKEQHRSSFKRKKWKQCYAVLDLTDGGSIFIYKFTSKNGDEGSKKKKKKKKKKRKQMSRGVVDRLQMTNYGSSDSISTNQSFSISKEENNENLGVELSLCIPCEYRWKATNVDNSSSFYIEIPTNKEEIFLKDNQSKNGEVPRKNKNEENGNGSDHDCSSSLAQSQQNDGPISLWDTSLKTTEAKSSLPEDNKSIANNALEFAKEEDALQKQLHFARCKGRPFLRLYFRCPRKGNEKALWMNAFSKLDRLSLQSTKKKKGMIRRFAASILNSRKRRPSMPEFNVREFQLDHRPTFELKRQVDIIEENEVNKHEIDGPNNVSTNGNCSKPNIHKEFRVFPLDSYPHQWLTKDEMKNEMIAPSEKFVDLAVPESDQKIIGTLQVEVLQCLGLPKLDRFSETDAVAYLVCGRYAFATDVIENQANPMWLRKTRRACRFPLHHGYARLYVGVFDDDRIGNDDFAGRVVIDIARLRPDSTYDVTLPLRLSTHVYTKRKRGAIRLRINLNWTSQKEAIMSYLPKTMKIPKISQIKPREDTTIICADQRAFRNVAITVHGPHMPGKFSFLKLRATFKEVAFIRKVLFTMVKDKIRSVRKWENPVMSGVVFLAWMHCVYAASFALVLPYILLFIWLHLILNYYRYGMDNPNQQGFIPPSLEEIAMSLLSKNRSVKDDDGVSVIEPLQMGYKHSSSKTSSGINNDNEEFKQIVSTHKSRGRQLFRFFTNGKVLEEEDSEIGIGEFPFSSSTDYPRFSVDEALCSRGNDMMEERNEFEYGDTIAGVQSNCPTDAAPTINDNDYYSIHRVDSHENKTKFSPRRLSMIPTDIMRKDTSGTKECYFDDEERKLGAVNVMTRTAAKQLKAGAKTAGFTKVVSPIKDGIDIVTNTTIGTYNHVVPTVRSSIIGSMHRMSQVGPVIRNGIRNSTLTPQSMLRRLSRDRRNSSIRRALSNPSLSNSAPSFALPSSHDSGEISFRTVNDSCSVGGGSLDNDEDKSNMKSTRPPPQQNIDLPSAQTGKKLTEEFDEIKEKTHEMTFHLFNDKVYTIKDPKTSCYFGHSKRFPLGEVEEWHQRDGEGVHDDYEYDSSSDIMRRATERKLNKLLQVGKFSNSNVVVSRIGLYIEPMLSSAQMFICALRALFNIFTWRDPYLSFWVTSIGLVFIIILLIFPWRLFLFVLGMFVVGPQNYVVRIFNEHDSIENFIHALKDDIFNSCVCQKPPIQFSLRLVGFFLHQLHRFLQIDTVQRLLGVLIQPILRHLQPILQKECVNEFVHRVSILRFLRKRNEKCCQMNDVDEISCCSTDEESSYDSDFDTPACRMPKKEEIFSSHRSMMIVDEKGKEEKLNYRELHHVVVPYSQLMYQQRFYDWPPEAQYATVKANQRSNNTKTLSSKHGNIQKTMKNLELEGGIKQPHQLPPGLLRRPFRASTNVITEASYIEISSKTLSTVTSAAG